MGRHSFLRLFGINKDPIHTDVPLIVACERPILFYDDAILLYEGKNKFDNWVIGYWTGVDEVEDIERHFRVIVEEDSHDLYWRREKTLLDLFKEAQPIYVVDYYGNGEIKIYAVSVEEIPEAYLPSLESYCPREEDC